MTPTLDELNLELDELKHLAKTSCVPRNKTRLNQAIESVSTEIRALEVSASTRLAESTTPAFPLGGSEDKKSMTDRIDNHHSVAQLGYKEVGSFSWDAGVGDVRDSVSCTFKERGFDLIVDGLKGGPCRLLKTNLDKDIDPKLSKYIVKQNKVIVKLKKIKNGMSYDYWTDLTEKRPKANDARGGGNEPNIMGMIKDLYDEGDDNTKKMLEEAMKKSRMENQM